MVLGGCGTAYNPLRPEVASPDFVPAWYQEPPVEEDFLHASARARSTNPSQAVERARRQATGDFTTILAEAVEGVHDPDGETTDEESTRWDRVLDRVESDPSSVLELEASRVGRDGDEYVAYVLLRASPDDLWAGGEPSESPGRDRLRELYNRLLDERTASRRTF